MTNREIDSRVPTIEPSGSATRQDARGGRHARHAKGWEYHRDGRDAAATLGFAGIVFIALVVLLFLAAALFRAWAYDREGRATAETRDGSTAGANAATVEELKASIAREEWQDGKWSVTKEDIERERELGQAYPPNGKEAAITTNTTYNRGAGMVDLITYDTVTNEMIRHYGQLDRFGNVRWYAAETVLDADGRPKIMPTE